MKRKHKKALAKLEHFISQLPEKRLKCNDAGFYRSTRRGKPYNGKRISAEEAYFLMTDKGIECAKEQVDDWERYKGLIIAHRLFGITVKQWGDEWERMNPATLIREWKEMHDDSPMPKGYKSLLFERLGFIKELEDDGFENPLKLITGRTCQSTPTDANAATKKSLRQSSKVAPNPFAVRSVCG